MVLVLVEAVSGRQIQYNPSTSSSSSCSPSTTSSSTSSSTTTITTTNMAALAAYISLLTEIPVDALILLTAKGMMLKDDELLNMAIQDQVLWVRCGWVGERRRGQADNTRAMTTSPKVIF